MARPITLITGASAGLGMALARVFAAHGHELVLIARREARLSQLAAEISGKGQGRPVVLAIDLAATDALDRIRDQLVSHDVEPDHIVNNAGFGLAGRAASLDLAEQLAMIDVNVRTLTALSLGFVDSLARHRGGLLNVASVAAFMPGPGMAVYYASKAYVLSLSEALHRELRPRGVRVSALCPGPVKTEFQARSGMQIETLPALLLQSPERVALDGYRGLKAGRRVIVPGLANRAATTFLRFAPHGLLLSMIERSNAGRWKL